MQLADLGVYVGTTAAHDPQPVSAGRRPDGNDRHHEKIGPERCIIGSDFGQVLHMDSIDGMRVFIRALLAFGTTKKEVKVMLQDSPAKLMYLD